MISYDNLMVKLTRQRDLETTMRLAVDEAEDAAANGLISLALLQMVRDAHEEAERRYDQAARALDDWHRTDAL